MKKHSVGRLSTSSNKLSRCSTSSSILLGSLKIRSSCQDSLNLIENFQKSKKKYSILNVPKTNFNEKQLEEEKKLEISNKESLQSGKTQAEMIEFKRKEAKAKKTLAILKKIKRSYRPNFLHNQENLKEELKKINNCSLKGRSREVFNENAKNEVKSDIEQILESQEFFKFCRKKNYSEVKMIENVSKKPRMNSLFGMDILEPLKYGSGMVKIQSFTERNRGFFSTQVYKKNSEHRLHPDLVDKPQTEITPKNNSNFMSFLSSFSEKVYFHSP